MKVSILFALVLLVVLILSNATPAPENPQSVGPQELTGMEQAPFCFKICQQPVGYRKVQVTDFVEQFDSIKAEICPGTPSGNCICDDMVMHYAETVGQDEVFQAAAEALDAVCGGGGSGSQ